MLSHVIIFASLCLVGTHAGEDKRKAEVSSDDDIQVIKVSSVSSEDALPEVKSKEADEAAPKEVTTVASDKPAPDVQNPKQDPDKAERTDGTVEEDPNALVAGPLEERPEFISVHENDKPAMIFIIPLTAVALVLALNLWAPQALAAGGFLASFIAVVMPSSLLRHLAASQEGTMQKTAFKWVTGGKPSDIESNLSVTDSASAKAHAKTKIKDWWGGGKLGKDAAAGGRKVFNWQPREYSNPSPAVDYSKRKAKLPKQAEASAEPPVPQHLTEQEIHASLLRIVEQEELRRTRLAREEGEDRWSLGRQEDTELIGIVMRAIHVEMRAIQEEESCGRRTVGSEWLCCLDVLRDDERYELQMISNSLAREMLCDEEELTRSALRAAEVAARDELQEDRDYDLILVETRPDRERMSREEAQDRMEVEDDEMGEWLFTKQSAEVLLSQQVESAARSVIHKAEALGWGQVVGTAQRVWEEEIISGETSARGAVYNEHVREHALLSDWCRLSHLEAKESGSRVKLHREERSMRKNLQVRLRSEQQVVSVRQSLLACEAEEPVARELIVCEEEGSFFAIDLSCELHCEEADEQVARRIIDEAEATSYSQALAALGVELASAMERERELVMELRARVLEATVSREEDSRSDLQAHELEEWSQLLVTAASDYEEAAHQERERLAAFLRLVHELENEECSARSPVADEEEEGFLPFTQTFAAELDEALERQKEREDNEEQARQVVVTEESEIRCVFEKTQALQWSTFLADEQDEKATAEVQGLVRAIEDTETATREVEEEAEDSERTTLQEDEFSERTKVNDDLIRNAPKAAVASTEVVRMKVVADGAQVRAGKSMQSAKVVVLNKGDIVHVVERVGKRARLHEHEGWVSVNSQAGMVILAPCPEGDQPVELPPKAEPQASPKPQTPTPQQPQQSRAEDALAQVSNSFGKGWRSFAGTLSEVRLPGTPMQTQPKKKTEKEPEVAEVTPPKKSD